MFDTVEIEDKFISSLQPFMDETHLTVAALEDEGKRGFNQCCPNIRKA